MTTLTTETGTDGGIGTEPGSDPSTSTCLAWCLGPAGHVEDAGAECVSSPVDLAPGVQAWLQCSAGKGPRVVVCGVAPELDGDALQVLLSGLAGLWARMV